MPSLAASHTVACTSSLSLAVSLVLDPGVLATQVPAYRVSPTEGSIVFLRAQHRGPFLSMAICSHPPPGLVTCEHRQLCQL